MNKTNAPAGAPTPPPPRAAPPPRRPGGMSGMGRASSTPSKPPAASCSIELRAVVAATAVCPMVEMVMRRTSTMSTSSSATRIRKLIATPKRDRARSCRVTLQQTCRGIEVESAPARGSTFRVRLPLGAVSDAIA